MNWRPIDYATACALYSSGGNLRIESTDGSGEYWQRYNGDTSSNSPGGGLVGNQGPSNRKHRFYTC